MVGYMNDWTHGCVYVCWLIVSSSMGLREINPRQRPPAYIGLRALRHARGPAGLLLTNNQHKYIHPTLHPTIHSSNHPFVHSPTHPFTHPSIHTFINTSIHSHPSILSIHSSILATLHPPTPPSTHV